MYLCVELTMLCGTYGLMEFFGQIGSHNGVLTSGPKLASWGFKRLDLFVRGADNALWHRWWNGSWSAWESLRGVLTSGPELASWGFKRLDLFVRGADNALWHR